MKSSFKIACLLAAAAVLAAAATARAEPGGEAGRTRQCFFPSNWNGWRSPDSQTIFIRVGVRDIYRLDLVGSYPGLRSGSTSLIHRTRGSSVICSPLDLDLRVYHRHGVSTPIIVKSMTKLSAEDAAALPAGSRP